MGDLPQFGTVSFYEEVAKQLNEDPEWRAMATPITYTMIFNYTEPLNKYFLVNFEAGEITEVAEMDSAPSDRHIDFLISGPSAAWARIIKGEIAPTAAMATALLKIDGKQTVLLRHMKKFSYMINKMTKIEAVFP